MFLLPEIFNLLVEKIIKAKQKNRGVTVKSVRRDEQSRYFATYDKLKYIRT